MAKKIGCDNRVFDHLNPEGMKTRKKPHKIIRN